MTRPIIQSIAEWSAGIDCADIPDGVRQAAGRCIVDTIGVGLAGAPRRLTQSVLKMAAREASGGPCTVFGVSAGLRPLGAALVSGTACHVLDFDDTCYDGIVHASCVILPAVLASCEDADADGSDLLASFVAGSEVTYILGRALPGIFWQGWWTTSVLGAIGAAAGAARAYKLDAEVTSNALALATCFTFGLRTLLGTDATPIGAGCAAEAGVRAALLAREGVAGPSSTMESDLGLARMFNAGKSSFEVIADLGRRYSLTESGIAYKEFPACSGTQAATQAIATLMRERSATAEQIRKVTCRVMPLVAENLRYPRPSNLTEAQFSLPFAIGCQLRFGAFGPKQLRDDVLSDTALQQEMAKVVMVRSEDLLEDHEKSLCPEAAEVSVELHDGQVLRKFVGAAEGMPSNPMSDAALDAKFMECATTLLTEGAARTLLLRLRNLGNLGPVRSLFTPAGSA